MNNVGKLYLVATPIGNLDDITLRALKILKDVDIIAAEDTRQTIKLLNHFEIKKSMVSYHEHNKKQKGMFLINQILEGKNVALVSDAGSPGISDPGEELVAQAIENGIEVTMAPGAVALIMGLVVSGLPTGRFVFEGFLPVNKRSRRERIQALKGEKRTIVLYEAPHKLMYTLKDVYEIFGERKIVLARELTKKFEEFIRTTISEAISKYENQSPKGEFVIILEGDNNKAEIIEQREKWADTSIEAHMDTYMLQGMSKKEAMKKVADDRGVSKREIYSKLLG